MKTTKKTSGKKPTFVVDLTNCETPTEVKFQFICDKAKAGVKLSGDDILFIMNVGANVALDAVDEVIEENTAKMIYTADIDKKKVQKIIKIIEKKDPWYKRFWNWLTRKNKSYSCAHLKVKRV